MTIQPEFRIRMWRFENRVQDCTLSTIIDIWFRPHNESDLSRLGCDQIDQKQGRMRYSFRCELGAGLEIRIVALEWSGNLLDVNQFETEAR